MNLPVPPDAFWTTVPWWAYMAFLTLAVVMLPFAIQYLRGKTDGYKTREEAALAGQAALDKQRDGFLLAVQADRDGARADLSRERAERHAAETQEREDYRRLDQNRIEGWNRGRGMEVEAHRLWHDLANLVMKFNGLLSIAQRLAAGQMKPELATERLTDFVEAEMPKAVPKLRDVDQKSPEETQYG